MTDAPTLFDFETSVQGWTGANISGGPWAVSDWSVNGSKSLKADVILTNVSSYALKNTTGLNLSAKTTLRARVKHASWGNVGNGMTAKLYIKTGSTWTWYDGGSVGINAITPTTLALNLNGVTNIHDIREIGIEFYTFQGSADSAVFVDYITSN
ncbi:hypothetical protein [Ectobacillus sp. JY-23]|uniref:hypothetical protein n=1 Tax=Ectobacillus sp. JY-23 TaxID=2933872 RepID=UPI0034A03D09